MAKEILFPFLDGKLLSFADKYYHGRLPNFEWRQNEIFEDTITYVTYSRGRSSALLIFKRQSNGEQVEFFMTDGNDLIPLLVNGSYTGKFTYTKRGRNHAVKAVL
jgi:hypothetical protein